MKGFVVQELAYPVFILKSSSIGSFCLHYNHFKLTVFDVKVDRVVNKNQTIFNILRSLAFEILELLTGR